MFGSPKSLPSKCLGVQRPTLTRYDWMSKVSSCTPKKLGSQYIDFRVVYTLIRKRSLIGTPRKAKFSGNWTVSSKIYRELKGVHRKFANNYNISPVTLVCVHWACSSCSTQRTVSKRNFTNLDFPTSATF